jgi:hypothetical protein
MVLLAEWPPGGRSELGASNQIEKGQNMCDEHVEDEQEVEGEGEGEGEGDGKEVNPELLPSDPEPFPLMCWTPPFLMCWSPVQPQPPTSTGSEDGQDEKGV